MKNFLMVGEQRSGSNLLRLILNESEEIAAPHPPHILQRMMPIVAMYGDLENEDNFSLLIKDACTLVELNPVPWELDKLDRQNVHSRCKQNNLIAVFGAIMDIYAEYHNANAWLCKSMQNIRWAKELNQYFDKPKYIYLYRDPRDVALSFSKAVIGEKHPYFIAQQWVELQELCITQRESLNEQQFFSLCYEDLINNTHYIIEKLCAFLEIQFTEKMLDFHKSNEAKRSASSSQLWENLSQPIKSSNSMKFLNELSKEEINIIELIAGKTMDKLSYERTMKQNINGTIINKDKIIEFQELNNRLKMIKKETINSDDLKRRNQQTDFLEEVILRQSNNNNLKAG